ncbi:MAG: 16S rRNA (uracil(1498)-N(3))-methyltransferase [Ruminococcaceae bacterium]|nr:16S rRNA (uracil(1498)-N(3))-methyltransferase [Oscillospiraceae bacterium]
MPRFFVTPDAVSEDQISIFGADAQHIARVLRMRVGDEITVCDTAGIDYACEILSLSPEQVSLKICFSSPTVAEPSVKVSLFVALSKGDKLDYIVQKAVELGVYDIHLFSSKYCVAKWSTSDATRKTERLSRIAAEAAKQCGRGIIPQVYAPISFSEMCQTAAQYPLPILCYEAERTQSLRCVLESRFCDGISVVIGSEGGFAPEEAEAAMAAGLHSVTLGKRILRCETAPACVLSAIFYHAGEL